MVERTPLGSFAVAPPKAVIRVETHRLVLPPGGETGLHHHPCPVVSFVLDGSVIVQFEGEAEQIFGPGEAVFEPANTTVVRFDNASDSAPATFIANYLLSESDQELIHLHN